MKTKNSFLRVIFAFLTAFFLFCAGVSLVFFVAGRPVVALKIAEVSNYPHSAAAEAEEKLSFIAEAGGFEKGFFDGTVTEKDIQNNFKLFIISSFGGEKFSADDMEIRQKFSEKIFAEAEEKMSGYSAQTRQILEQTVSLCAGYTLSVATPRMIGYLGGFLNRFKITFLIAFSAFFLLFSVSLFILERQSRTLAKTALIGVSLMLGVAPVSALIFLKPDSLSFESQALKDFISAYIFCILISFAALSVLIFAISLFIRKKDPVSN